MKNIFFFVILSVYMASTLAQKNCDKLGIRVYEDMGCTPKYRRCFQECPEEFVCHNLYESPGKCYYKNLTLEIDELVSHPDQFCDFACLCTEGGKFICAMADCPDILGITPPPGCYTTYDLKRCCSVSQICGLRDSSKEKKRNKEIGTWTYQCRGEPKVTCKYRNETYKEGIRFFPKDSCSMCVCQKGFRGKIEAPFCTRRKCNVQLHAGDKPQQRCAPVYNIYDSPDAKNNILCCPNQWICPSGNETVVGTPISDKICFFGTKQLNVGQRIETNTGITCDCKIPPLLTCTPKK